MSAAISDDEWEAMHRREVEREAEYAKRLKDAATNLAEIVVESAFLSRWGDGYCGYVFRTIEAALNDAGVETIEPRRPSPYRSKNTLPVDIRALVFARDGLHCQHCGTDKNLTVDHIIATVNGGSDELDNLQTLCKSCNSKKGKK